MDGFGQCVTNRANVKCEHVSTAHIQPGDTSQVSTRDPRNCARMTCGARLSVDCAWTLVAVGHAEGNDGQDEIGIDNVTHSHVLCKVPSCTGQMLQRMGYTSETKTDGILGLETLCTTSDQARCQIGRFGITKMHSFFFVELSYCTVQCGGRWLSRTSIIHTA
jgi:hypothetical protein